MSAAPLQAIPDIHIGRVYDQRDPECEIHYETFGRLADFFGRNTPPHRHYCFYQLHLLVRGSVRLSLDGQVYGGDAPLLIFTPPTIPHSFYSEEDTDGHVLTVRQEVVRGWYRAMPGQWPDALLRAPVFFELASLPEACGVDFAALLATVELLQRESERDAKGHTALQLALGEGVFIHLSRLLLAREPATAQRPERSEDLRLFLNFTEARLNDICRRMANLPSKEVVDERLLRYSAVPVSEISYQLGFADPACFSRFFTKRTDRPPSQFRLAGQQ